MQRNEKKTISSSRAIAKLIRAAVTRTVKSKKNKPTEKTGFIKYTTAETTAVIQPIMSGGKIDPAKKVLFFINQPFKYMSG